MKVIVNDLRDFLINPFHPGKGGLSAWAYRFYCLLGARPLTHVIITQAAGTPRVNRLFGRLLRCAMKVIVNDLRDFLINPFHPGKIGEPGASDGPG